MNTNIQFRVCQKSPHRASNTQTERVQEKPGLRPSRIQKVKSELGNLGYDVEVGGLMSEGWALESCSEAHGSSWEFLGVCWSRGKRKNVGVSSSLNSSQMASHAGRKSEQK